MRSHKRFEELLNELHNVDEVVLCSRDEWPEYACGFAVICQLTQGSRILRGMQSNDTKCLLRKTAAGSVEKPDAIA